MRTTLLLTAALISAAASAQVFESDLETWIGDTIPADWDGEKTNLEYDSLSQVSVNPHGGTYAVRLVNMETSTRRFSTQPLALDSAQSYDVTYWVRGEGEVRIAIFDGRTENNGYSPNTSYEIVTGNTWTQLTANVVCDHTNPAAEFIVYLRGTDAPEHLVLDDVNITVGGVVVPTEASIYEIQYTTAPDGASPLNGDVVITGGIVTGVDTIGASAYFIQNGTGPWSGIYVYDQSNFPVLGDSVLLQASVDEFSGATTELVNVTSFSVVGQYPLPTPQLLDTDGATEEQWEGVLSVIANAECTSLPDAFNEWGISQPSGPYLVDDLMHAYTPTVGENYDITGCIHFANGTWKIEPRFPADVVVATGVEETGAFSGLLIGPNPTSSTLSIRLGSSDATAYVLFDVTGRTVRNGWMRGQAELDLGSLQPGTYQLRLHAGEAQHVENIVVVR